VKESDSSKKKDRSSTSAETLSESWMALLKSFCKIFPEVLFAALLRPYTQTEASRLSLASLSTTTTQDVFYTLLVELSLYTPGLWVNSFVNVSLSYALLLNILIPNVLAS